MPVAVLPTFEVGTLHGLLDHMVFVVTMVTQIRTELCLEDDLGVVQVCTEGAVAHHRGLGGIVLLCFHRGRRMSRIRVITDRDCLMYS